MRDKKAAKKAAKKEASRSKKRLLGDSAPVSSKRLRVDQPEVDETQDSAQPPQQRTVMQIIAQPPDTVDMAELQRLRSLPSVANTVTSEEEDDEEGEPAGQRRIGAGAEPASRARSPEQRMESNAAAAHSSGRGDSTRIAVRVAKRKKKGERQLASGDVQAAIATFEAALALAPDDSDVLLLKSTAEAKLQKPKKDRSEEKKRRRREQKAAKRAKLNAHFAEKGGRNAIVTPSVASEHPFEVTDEKDHAETPFDAYVPIIFYSPTRALPTCKFQIFPGVAAVCV